MLRGMPTRLVLLAALLAAASATAQLKEGLQPLPPAPPTAPKPAGDAPDLGKETFFIALPHGFSPQRPHGLFLYMHPADRVEGLPEGWDAVLTRHDLVFVAPQKVGNEQEVRRRLAIAEATAQRMKQILKIAPERLFIGGFSGGGRMSGDSVLLHPDLFDGALGICGLDFCREVPRVKATRTDRYGIVEVPPEQVAAAKANARIAIVTGSEDFRYGNLQDLYEGGLKPDGFTAQLFDVPHMGHELCSAKVLDEALTFLEGGASAPGRRGTSLPRPGGLAPARPASGRTRAP